MLIYQITSKNLVAVGDAPNLMRRYVSDTTVDMVYCDAPWASGDFQRLKALNQEGSGAALAADNLFSLSDMTVKKRGELFTYGKEAEQLLAYLDYVQRTKSEGRYAYCINMADLIYESCRALKPSGTFWTHCREQDSTYLVEIFESILGEGSHRDYISWYRMSGNKNDAKTVGYVTDRLLYFVKPPFEGRTWKQPRKPLSDEQRKKYGNPDNDARGDYKLTPCHLRKGKGTMYPWPPDDPTRYPGREWRFSPEKMRELESEKRLVYGKTTLLHKTYLKGDQPLTNIWDQPAPLTAAEKRVGAEDMSQKPQALLEMLIEACTEPGDVVLDPCVGSGTTALAAAKLKRRFFAIDVSDHAIAITKKALAMVHPHLFTDTGRFKASEVQEPRAPITYQQALQLALENKEEFELWWLADLKVRWAGRNAPTRDGYALFRDGGGDQRIWFQVKGGKEKGNLRYVALYEKEIRENKYQFIVWLCVEPPTGTFRTAMQDLGVYVPYDRSSIAADLPVGQILTLEEYFNGALPRLPVFLDNTPHGKLKPRTAQVTQPRKDHYDENEENIMNFFAPR